MNDLLKNEILKRLGTLDGIPMFLIFKALGVKDGDVEFYDRGLSIPAKLIKDPNVFHQELRRLSKTGRTFKVSVSGDRAQIDVCTFSKQYLSRNNFFYTKKFWDSQTRPIADTPTVKKLMAFIENKNDVVPENFYEALAKGVELADDMFEVTKTGHCNPYRKKITFIASDSTKGDGVNPESMDYFLGTQVPWMSLIVPILERKNFYVEVLSWKDPNVDWKSKLLVFIGPVWGYTQNLDEFEGFLTKLEKDNVKVFNDIKFIQWIFSKSYLLELQEFGINVPPTMVIEPNSDITVKQILEDAKQKWGSDDVIIKGVVDACALGYKHINTTKIDESETHLGILKKQNKGAIVQQFLPDVGAKGELAFVFFGEQLSHYYLKVPKKGEEKVQHFYGGHSFHIKESNIKATIDDIKKFNSDINISENELLEAKKQAIEYRKKMSALLKLKGIEELINLRIDGVITERGFIVMEMEGLEPDMEIQPAMDNDPYNKVDDLYVEVIEKACRTSELSLKI